MFGLVGTAISRVQVIIAAVVIGALLAALPTLFITGYFVGKNKCEANIMKSSAKADVRAEDVVDALDAVEDNTQPILDQGRDKQDEVIEDVREENYLLRVEIDKLKEEAEYEDTTHWDNGDLPASVQHKWNGINQQVFGPKTKPLPDGENLAGGDAGSEARETTEPHQ